MTARSAQIYFTGNPLDRAAQIRALPDELAARRQKDDAGALVFWRGKAFVLTAGDQSLPRMAWLPTSRLDEIARASPAVFLGLGAQDSAWFAVDLSELEKDDAVARISENGAFVDVRSLGLQGFPAADAAVLAQAKSLLEWHRSHIRCSVCGVETEMADAGYRRRCPSCAANHFPRTDPVVIALATFGDKCLLGRTAQTPPGVFSALAGFVEPGESVEEAAAREVMEEAGIAIRNVRYLFSQPWPYPSSLMLGCLADADHDAITFVDNELEDARWFELSDIRRALNGDRGLDFMVPPPLAIARQLLEVWALGYQV